MKWIIEGSDAHTEALRTITVEALDERDAIANAKKMGVLVSKATPINPPQTTSDSSTSADITKKYQQIVRGGCWLDILGNLLLIFACLLAIYGLMIFLSGIGTGGIPAVISGGSIFVSAVTLAAGGMFLKLSAAVALAIRDIAINTAK